MSWPVWSKANEKSLAQYALPDLANRLRLAVTREDALAKPGGRRAVAEEIYRALSSRDVRYSRPLYNPDLAQQIIRDPDTVLDGSGDGTCLDLALLYAGVALGNELLPLVIVFDDHAFVGIALDAGRRDADAGWRRVDHGDWVNDGILRDSERLRSLVDSGHFLLVECTGFATSQAIPDAVPEGRGRIDGRMSFDRAVAAGREQLDHPGRRLQFAIDVAHLQDVGKLVPLDPFGRSLEHLRPQLKRRLGRLFEARRIFGGRDAELAQLDEAITIRASSYQLVTGYAGSGKSALLANWVRSLERREIPVAYHFLNRQYGTAAREETLLSLVQQLRYWYGRGGMAGGAAAELEAEYLDLIANPPPFRLVIVIDGIDEAEDWVIGPQLFPGRLPHGLHVVVSARTVADRNWATELKLTNPLPLELGRLTKEGVAEVVQHSGAPEWVLEPDALEALNSAVDGDPFYLRVVIDDLLAGRVQTRAALATHPQGVDEYLRRWWDDIQGTVAHASVADLLGYLLVARGPISRSDLIGVGPADALTGFTFDQALGQVRRFVVGEAEPGFALAHWRFQDYLTRKVLTIQEQEQYRSRLVEWCAGWRQHSGRYALRYQPTNLLAALPDQNDEERLRRLEEIVDLLCDPEYQRSRVELTDDVVGLQTDLERALAELARGGALAWISALARAALKLDALRERWLRPEGIFDLGRKGDVEAAERRLALFQTDESWRDAALLITAWHGVSADSGRARRLLQRFGKDWAGRPPLPLLRDRILAHLGDASRPILELPYYPNKLPDSPAQDDVEFRVRRIGANTSPEVHYSGLRGRETLRHQAKTGGAETPTYIAEGDAPSLVAFAIANPPAGTALLDQYVAIHAGNPYADYRNRSLWGILGAVLCHPIDGWVLDFATSLAIGALAPTPIRFRAGLGIAVEASRARLGDAEARARFEESVARAHAVRNSLVQTREGSDRWGNLCRRFAVLAEAAARILGEPVLARDLLDSGHNLPFGFAGYQAPASLTLAETNLIVRPESPLAATAALDAALRAAHNVQDPGFCARTTARVNALRAQWWAMPIQDLEGVVAEFARDPVARRFAPAHVVGDVFAARPQVEERIPLDHVSAANTLHRLATQVFHLPVPAFERLNPDFEPHQPLAPGTTVRVPDPKFAPLLATRFAAEALAAPLLTSEDRIRVLMELVPVAAVNATTLDTVLTRLLLAAPQVDAYALDRLGEMAPSWEEVDGPLGREALTALAPEM